MASVKISGDSSGVITLAAPSASGTNTITMPASTGTMALTSDIPAGGGWTLLSTLNTTSGTSVATGTLDLSTYKSLLIDTYSVGNTGAGGKLQLTANGGSAHLMYTTAGGSSSQAMYGTTWFQLPSGIITSVFRVAQARSATSIVTSTGPGDNSGVYKSLSTSSTSITFTWDGGETFDVGQIKIYGVK